MTQNTHNQAPDTAATTDHPVGQGPSLAELTKVIGRRSVCTLATSSPRNWPHAAAVIYAAVGTTLYVSTSRSSRKARNIAANPHVGVVVPVRRLPVGPPAEVHFQGTAEVLDLDDPHIVDLLQTGQLKKITSHGELDHPDGCFLRITPGRRIYTYALGMPLLRVLRDPLNAAGVVEVPDTGMASAA